MTRLAYLSSDLASRLHAASAVSRRAACLAACEYAMVSAKMDQAIVGRIFQKLRTGCMLTNQEKVELKSLVERLDADYLDLQEIADASGVDPGVYMRTFAQARAAAALSSAASGDDFDSASEAIYEAAATVEDPATLINLMTSVLGDPLKIPGIA